MKLKMAENSLFAILLRSSWWISATIAAVLVALSFALLPKDYRVIGAMSAIPFVAIAFMAARRQWRAPSAARIEQTVQAAAAMPWPAFATVLEQAFRRDRFEVQRHESASSDFVLTRDGRRMLVGARRWKSARTGLEPLRALQNEREAGEYEDALHIGLGELSEPARAYAAQHRIAIWQAGELAQALRGLDLPAPKAR